MYSIDNLDRVEELKGIPAHSAGAPMPCVFASDSRLLLAYEAAPGGEEIVVLEFVGLKAHYFGAPNDEALSGHPLAMRGLLPYGTYEVLSSSWIRLLEKMNSIHPFHDKRRFERLRHFIFTFHDKTFECVADDVKVVERGPNKSGCAQRLIERLTSL